MNRMMLAVIVGSVATLAGCSTPKSTASAGAMGGCCLVNVPAATGTALAPESANALLAALEDERRSQAFYEGVIARHGKVRPFSNIIRAEQNHERAVIAVMERYKLPIPQATAPSIPPVSETFAACASTAAQVERDNIALYDRLLPTIREGDVKTLFENLRAASKNHHLPAFQRWAGA